MAQNSKIEQYKNTIPHYADDFQVSACVLFANVTLTKPRASIGGNYIKCDYWKALYACIKFELKIFFQSQVKPCSSGGQIRQKRTENNLESGYLLKEVWKETGGTQLP